MAYQRNHNISTNITLHCTCIIILSVSGIPLGHSSFLRNAKFNMDGQSYLQTQQIKQSHPQINCTLTTTFIARHVLPVRSVHACIHMAILYFALFYECCVLISPKESFTVTILSVLKSHPSHVTSVLKIHSLEVFIPLSTSSF